MRPFDIPSLHPSRTRATHGGSKEEKNPFLVKYGFPDAPGQTSAEKPKVERNKWLWWVDFWSAFLSFGAFWTALIFASYPPRGLSGTSRFTKGVIPIWKENVLVVATNLTGIDERRNEKALELLQSIDHLDSSLKNFCNASRELYREKRLWSNATYEGTAFIHPAGSFNPWVLLLCVFALSFAFQFSRLKQTGERKEERKKTGWRNIEVFVFYFDDYLANYDPLRPDYWRWLEYTLTSPLQVVLIAVSVMLKERSQIASLAGLQAGHVLLGFMNEKHIDKFYKKAAKGKKGEKLWVRLLFQMGISWALFSIVWAILIGRFNLQFSNLSDCEYATDMPWQVYVVVWGQFTLFLLFGLAQTWQVWWCLYVKDKSLFQNVDPTENQLSGIDGGEVKQSIEERRAQRWGTMSMVYSVLSVTAKTLLEFGFIALVLARERMIPNA